MSAEEMDADSCYQMVFTVRGRAACERLRQVLAEPDPARASFDHSRQQLEVLQQGMGQLLQLVNSMAASVSVQEQLAQMEAAGRPNGHRPADAHSAEWANGAEHDTPPDLSSSREAQSDAGPQGHRREPSVAQKATHENTSPAPKDGWLRRWPLHLLATAGFLLCSGTAYWIFRT